MSLDKFIFWALIFSKFLYAEGVPFHVSSSMLAPTTTIPGQTVENSDPESGLINDLKYLAVSNWLHNYLGQRYTQFDKFITPEFSEKYILDYKVNRTNQPVGTLDLIGHIDGDSLKKWVRLVDSKSKGSNQIKPLFILSSNLTGLSISPSDTANKLRDSAIAQSIAQLAQGPVQKLNARLIPNDSTFNLEAPPKNGSEIQSLISLANRRGETLVIWAALSACPGCTTPRFDVFVYNTSSQSLAFVVGDDLALTTRDLANQEILKKSLTPIFQQFQTELENMYSEGTVLENPYRLIVESIDSYRTLKLAEAELSRGNGFSIPVLKKTAGKSAEYEIKSSLSIDELAQKIQSTSLPGFKTQVSKLDSSSLVLKYLK